MVLRMVEVYHIPLKIVASMRSHFHWARKMEQFTTKMKKVIFYSELQTFTF